MAAAGIGVQALRDPAATFAVIADHVIAVGVVWWVVAQPSGDARGDRRPGDRRERRVVVDRAAVR